MTIDTKQPHRFNKKWLWLLPLVAFVILSIFLFSRLGVDPKVVPMATLDKPLPQFKLSDLMSEKTLTNADLPKQPYLLNIWGSWCPTCAKEHPELNRLNQQGVKIIGVNYKDEPESAMQYLAEKGNPYQKIIQDYKGQLGLDLGVTGAPENFVVDQNGVIRAHYVGEITQDAWQKMIAPCMQALASHAANACKN